MRCVGDEEQKKQAPLGNWVGSASGWHPSPSSQWFWTDSGEKLVPVLTYTAYLPYVDLPTLSATAVQLPLDVRTLYTYSYSLEYIGFQQNLQFVMLN